MKYFLALVFIVIAGIIGYFSHPAFFPAEEVVESREIQDEYNVTTSDGRKISFKLSELSADEHPEKIVSTKTLVFKDNDNLAVLRVAAGSPMKVLGLDGDQVKVGLEDRAGTALVHLNETDFFKRIVKERDKKEQERLAAMKTEEKPVMEEEKPEEKPQEATPREIILSNLQSMENPPFNEALIQDVSEISSDGDQKTVKITYLTALFFEAEAKEATITLDKDKVVDWGTAQPETEK